MFGESKQATSATAALAYLTIGALTMVWTGIYYIQLQRSEPPASESAFFWCAGFFFSGMVLLAIGLCVGYIGRAAMAAEVAATPAVVTPVVNDVARPANVAPAANANLASAAAAAATPNMVPAAPSAPAPAVPVTTAR